MLELSEIKISKQKSELEDGTRYSTVNNYEAENSMKKKENRTITREFINAKFKRKYIKK